MQHLKNNFVGNVLFNTRTNAVLHYRLSVGRSVRSVETERLKDYKWIQRNTDTNS